MHKLAVAVIVVGGLSAANASPKVSLGAAEVDGGVDAKAVTKVVKRSQSKLLACYRQALKTAPLFEGEATVNFEIDATGKVVALAPSGMIPEVEGCVATTFSRIKFAKPKDGKAALVRVPLTFEADLSSGFDDTNIYGGLLGNEAGEMNGGFGFGRSGFGPGGGGTGWGTLATGKQGTGSGTGRGYGNGRPRKVEIPSVALGKFTVQGALDPAIVRRYIKRNVQKLLYCYEKELLAKSTLKGTANIELSIDSGGIVTGATATGFGDANVEGCIANVVKAIEFPRPKSAEVTVKSSLTYAPGAVSVDAP